MRLASQLTEEGWEEGQGERGDIVYAVIWGKMTVLCEQEVLGGHLRFNIPPPPPRAESEVTDWLPGASSFILLLISLQGPCV